MEAERQARADRQQATALEQTLSRRESAAAERQAAIDRLEQELTSRDKALREREQITAAAVARYEQLVAQQKHELERVAGLTADEAKELLIKQIEGEARHDSANLLKRLDAEARETAVDRAKQYITEAIQRCGAEHAIETTVSVVDLPSDDLKGRIIGREGRNIRALELATGVDLIVDDTPGAIILSGFDPYRREIAKQAIERLIADGRIHPARIEEVVAKVKDETDEAMRKEGAAVAFELGLHDLHPEIHRLMGRLKYRTSYGQNVLAHSAEVARLAGIMAREVGLDAHVAVRAAFVHDIGKAIDREMEGTHLQIGIDFLRKHGESEAVVMAMAAHHMDIDWPSLEAMIVQAADAISAARPGRAPRHPRVLRQAAGEARRDRRLVQGRLEIVRAAGRPRDPDHGREREDFRRGSRLAVEGHRAADRERARIPGPDQGDGDSRNPRRRLREVTTTISGRRIAEVSCEFACSALTSCRSAWPRR